MRGEGACLPSAERDRQNAMANHLRRGYVRLLDLVKSHTPWAVRRLSRQMKREIHWVRNARRPAQAVFEAIYEQNAWGGEKGILYSGPGSVGSHAKLYA